MIRRLDHGESQTIAGAIACDGRSLVVGTYEGGYLRYSFPDLQLVETQTGLFRDSCNGIQFSGDDLVLLGLGESQSLATHADWKHSLHLISHGGIVKTTALGPGNWSLVKAMSGDVAVVYDTSEEQGMKAVDVRTGEARWSMPGHADRVIHLGEGLLASLGERLTLVEAPTGRVMGVHELPLSTEMKWTAVAKSAEHLVMAGHTVLDNAVAFARWDPTSPEVERSIRFPLDRFFTQERIAIAMDDDHCGGPDIFRVAAMRASGVEVVAVIGGDGEHVGSCHSACALATLDASTLELKSHAPISDEDGASALLIAPDGSIVLDCGGETCVVTGLSREG